MKLSRDIILFFMSEVRNVGGTQPATLGSAYDSFKQVPELFLLSWCGYGVDYPQSETKRLVREMGVELRRLIRKYGKKQELENLIGR